MNRTPPLPGHLAAAAEGSFTLPDAQQMAYLFMLVSQRSEFTARLYPHLLAHAGTSQTADSCVTLVTAAIEQFALGDVGKRQQARCLAPDLIEAMVHDETALQATLYCWWHHRLKLPQAS